MMGRVLVTGALGGIGRAIVAQFATAGYEVLATGLRRGQSAEGAARTVVLDVTDEGDLESLRHHLQGRGLDAVVAAHGVTGAGKLETATREDVRRIIDVNAGSLPRLLDACRPALRRTGGAFVVIASQSGLKGEAGLAFYCASKFAAVGWVRSAHAPEAAGGIRLRALCPGMVNTPFLTEPLRRVAAEQGRDFSEYMAWRLAEAPLGRLADPAEVAAAALYLAEARGWGPVVLNQSAGTTQW